MFEVFENKIKGIKDRCSKETKVLTVVIIIGIIVMILINTAKLYKVKNQKLEDTYNNAMYQLIDYSKEIEVLLAKARITTSKKEAVITYTDILRQSNLASTALFLLPVDQNKLQNMAKYYAQTADFALSLSNKLLINKSLEKKDFESLEKLEKYAIKLINILTDIYANLNDESLKWNELEKELNKELGENEVSLSTQNVKKLSDTFTEYEGLIYDGAYSDHTEQSKAKMLTGKNITVKEAEKKVRNIIENKWLDKEQTKKITEITYKGETGERVVVYNFEVMLKGSKEKVSVQITKDTGLVYLMLYDRTVKKSNIDFEKAKELGLEFLKNIGIKNMESTYYLIQNNMITINYASVQNNVIIYPDLIKLKIALDTGEICSLEAKGYIYNHRVREELLPKISIAEAKAGLNRGLKIQSDRLAIIQENEQSEEVLTYEFMRKN